MAHPDGERSVIGDVRKIKPGKMDLSASLLSPFHLMTALLERDKNFASSILPDGPPGSSILDVVDRNTVAALDQQ